MRGIFMDRAKQSLSAFFPPSGLDCLLCDITGEEYMELERPPSCGEHAHTVDEQQEVMSIRFRSVCDAATDDSDEEI